MSEIPASVLENPEFRAPYELCEKIGEGGMGVVFPAVQRSLDRPVAIKFMRSSLGVMLESGERRSPLTELLSDLAVARERDTMGLSKALAASGP